MEDYMNNRLKKVSNLNAYIFIAPAVILMLAFIVYPLLSSFQLSTMEWSGLGGGKFIGFENYTILFKDPVFWNSIKLQFVWALLSVLILALTGLFLALIVEYFVPFRKMVPVFRTILFMPMMMSMVAIGLLWTMVFNPMIGLLNEFLQTLGILSSNQPLDLLSDNRTALFAVFIPAIWQWSGFGMVVFSAAMQGIPQDILEASVVDGCNRFRQVRYIIFPLLAPTFALLCTMNLIGGLKCFDIIYIMTAGGPGISTQVTSIYIFRQAFVLNAHGYSAAISSLMFLLTTGFGVIFFRFTNRLESYI